MQRDCEVVAEGSSPERRFTARTLQGQRRPLVHRHERTPFSLVHAFLIFPSRAMTLRPQRFKE